MSDGMVKCPGCPAEYDGSGYDPGDRFQCPECNTIVTIPGAAKASAAPKAAAARGGTHRMSRGSTGRASRPPAHRGTSKMNVVNNAVGMGALDPTVDPKAIRRAGQAVPQTQSDGGEKMLLYGGVGVVAIAIIGLIIYIAKQPSSEDKKKANIAKKAAAEAKEKEEAAAKGSSASTPENGKDKPKFVDPWDVDKSIVDDVTGVLSLLKGKTQDVVFWKTAARLLRHGPLCVPPLIDKIKDPDVEVALAARAILDRLVHKNLPEAYFSDLTTRTVFHADLRDWWLKSGAQVVMTPEAQFIGEGGGDSTSNPGNPPPTNPGGSGNGVTEVKKTGGGVSEAAMRRDLPQHLANYVHGTPEERDRAEAEIRKYGKQVIGALINMLKEDDVAIANAANDMLQRFTKQEMGRVPGEPGDRGPFIEKWQSWWKGAEASFTM